MKLIPRCLAYADDVTVLSVPKASSINAIFKVYEQFTYISGLELNASKTEILITNDDKESQFRVDYMGKPVKIITQQSIIIGGIIFATDAALEYKSNVTEKIEKMKHQLNKWLCRDLTLRGRSIIAKTYGLSQIIYSLHVCTVEKEDINNIERAYFKFLWGNKPERISRAKLKNSLEEGGINAPDIKSSHQPIKQKLVGGAKKTKNDYIGKLQLLLLRKGNDSFEESLNYYFNRLCSCDEVTKSAQNTINNILCHYDKIKFTHGDDEPKTDLINMILNTDIESYLRFHNKLIACQQFRRMNASRASTVKIKDMFREVTEELFDVDEWQNIMAAFQHLPEYMKNTNLTLHNIATDDNIFCSLIKGRCKNIGACSSSEIQHLLKMVDLRTEEIDWEKKHNITMDKTTRVMRTRKAIRLVKNQKLRNIVTRVWHGDIFSRQRMKKFNMIDSEICSRCDRIETIEHQIFKCKEASQYWNSYNQLIYRCGMEECQVYSYEDIILPTACDNEISFTLKAIVININILKERPKYENRIFKNFIMKLIEIEKHLQKKVE
jgi:hypothetical protein